MGCGENQMKNFIYGVAMLSIMFITGSANADYERCEKAQEKYQQCMAEEWTDRKAKWYQSSQYEYCQNRANINTYCE